MGGRSEKLKSLRSGGIADLSNLFLQFAIHHVVKMPSGAIHLTAVGITPGSTNIVEASTNLSTWRPISTNVTSSTTFAIIDEAAPGFGQRFYRLIQLP
jgi:hypothetical protein